MSDLTWEWTLATSDMWSCTFIRDGNAFWFSIFLNVKQAADEAELMKIVDSTEVAPAR